MVQRVPKCIKLLKGNFSAINPYYSFLIPLRITYYLQMLLIMHIPAFYVNHKAMTKTLGQSHIFRNLYGTEQKLVCNQKGRICSPKKHIEVWLLPKRCKIYPEMQPPAIRTISVQRHEDCKFGWMGNVTSGIWYHIHPHKRLRQHPHRCYLPTMHNQHLWWSWRK